ncbi:hypothetical protein EVG20_g10373 [Dentipellis fragilis]|uniref:Uncharacterized protein n=1 Tax=Dentipellis fragilis TaxID=205917 RepID=A0A4Y9XS34_9AGAM|nr:hypothetical protein EVG20_g10373 [Dentipellis fragilis]
MSTHHKTAIREDEPVDLEQQPAFELRLWRITEQESPHATRSVLEGHCRDGEEEGARARAGVYELSAHVERWGITPPASSRPPKTCFTC